jgi:hypothetical protein
MRNRAAGAIVVLAVTGVAIDVALPGPRDWLYYHAFTNAVLVGVLLIAATYLVVERALEERSRERWSAAAAPLLRAIASAGVEVDRRLRSGTGDAAADCEWLAQLLERFQSQLTGTPELMAHWHAALSLSQHARAALNHPDGAQAAEYEAAWKRFCATFADAGDGVQGSPGAGATWRLPTVGH